MTSNRRSLDTRPSPAYLFHSGLCGMFRTSKEPRQQRRHSKTDACALAFCGIWLWQRNKYLLTGEKPKRWKDKPLDISIVILLVATAIVWSLDPHNAALPLLLLVIMGCFLWKIFEFQYSRSIFREQLAIQEYIRQKKEFESEASEEDGTRTTKQVVYLTNEHIIDPHNDPDLIQFLSQQHKREVYGDGAHALCGCANSQLNPINTGDDDGDEGGDCCLSLWAFLANSCCGWLCRCYCQLCGMCAIAQEHRFLTEVLPEDPTLWQRDYVTLQSWQDYYPAIVRLRVAGKMNFFSHLRATSELSYRLIVTAATSLLFVTLVTLLPVHFPRWQIFVLYGTLFQPLLILFFVYWLWHRLDISLDAVVKYFAAGFFICTGISVLYEMMVSMLASIAIYLISILEAIGMILAGAIDLDDVLAKDDDEIGDRDSSLPIAYSLSIALTTAFLNAFFVAALVEELVKYLCFWMVEHPDLEPDGVLLSTEFSKGARQVADKVGTDTSKLSMRGGNTQSEIPTEYVAPTCSYVSWGAAITVAMVTTALGFACAENLLYVFVYTPHVINEEVSTLMVRCLFPIHPLAAALQSLGVCRRELECQPHIQVGRIVFPAWLLHGSFDFSLMAYSLITQLLSTNSDDDSTMAPSSFQSDGSKFLVVSCVMIAPIWAVVFYFKEAWEQRDRLEALDGQATQMNYKDW